MSGLKRLLLTFVVLAVLAVSGWRYATHWQPSPDIFAVQGVDVDESTGPIEWKVVAGAGADFAYATATHGTQRDRRFEENWQATAAAGLRRGAVHAWSLCASGTDQANAFNTMVPRDPQALPMAIAFDYVEGCAARPDRAVLIREVKRAAAMIEAHTGKPVLLRLAPRFEGDYDLANAVARPVWAVGNFLRPTYAARAWRMWRASDMRRIDGIDGPVNWDVAAS